MRQSLETRLQKLEERLDSQRIEVVIVHGGESKEDALARMGIDMATVDKLICIMEPERCANDKG